jgi:uncharacterized ferritin-like protein (DUF455 family)
MDPGSNHGSLQAAAHAALVCADVDAKLARVAAALQAWQAGMLPADAGFVPGPMEEPGRPPRPILVAPREVQRRSTASAHERAALIHALAHIEFNAINLALDAACRFTGLPASFYADWLRIAAEEACHFSLLAAHLGTLGQRYGDFPAHDGLWQMARKTAHDPLLRMALVPRVLEARGLDASPGIIRRLAAAGDAQGAAIVGIILRDEVDHVAVGSRWYRHLCAQRGLDPDATFIRLLEEYAAPRPALPLNAEARQRARFSRSEMAALEAMALARRGRPRPNGP